MSRYEDFDDGRIPEWHEFGHHVMADGFGNARPTRIGDVNHAGYENHSTTDSWVEGWAEFWSMAVAAEVETASSPWLYWADGWPNNLEANWKPWAGGRGEEFAVAGMLWDLYDGKNVPDRDNVDLTFDRLRDILFTNQYASYNPDLGNGYPFDVQAVYSATVRHAGQYGYSYSVSDVDEIFKSHGLFYDRNGNKRWNAGEQVGKTADAARPERRFPPPIPGSYVQYTAFDQAGQPLTVADFVVSVNYAPPFQDYSHTFEMHGDTQASGLLYAGAPPPGYTATVVITPTLAGYAAVGPFTYTTELYWSRMALEPATSFITTTFRLKARAVYLPAILRQR
jgi:hypothetical protein